ncbi:MAG: MFS transporter [Nocardioides sp.]
MSTSEDTAAPGRRSRRRAGAASGPRRADQQPIPGEIKVLIASAFVIAIGFGIISPVLPAYARSFDVGVAAASFVVSIFAFFRLLGAPGSGVLVARLGERWVYLTGLGIVAASSLLTAVAQTYWQLLVFRGLGGLGSTMFTVSAMALLVRLAPPTMRGRVSSAYASSFLIGGMLGPVLGGLMAGLGLRVPFVVYAAALVIAALVVGVRLSHASLRPDPTATAQEPMRLGEGLRDSAYRAALASAFANGWANFGVRVAIVPQFAVAVHDETWVAGVALAVAAAGTAASLQFSGKVTDTVGRKPMVVLGLGVTAVSLGSLGLSESLTVLLVLSLVSGFGAGMVNPGQQATVADVIGNQRSGGTVLSTFQMAQDGGAIIGPVLIGVVADQAGWGWAFAVTGLVSLLALPLWLAARETLQKEPVAVTADQG